MKPRDAAKQIQRDAERAVREVAVSVKDEFKQRTPSKYKKTRRALYAKGSGTQATVGLNFAKEYSTRGTKTLQRFENHWQQIRPQAKQLLIDKLNSILKG